MGKKTTVGFLVSGITDEFIESLCRGIMAESEDDDINLVVIPVKYIDREMKDLPDIHEYQYKTNAANITAANIDILIIIADCIGCLTDRENLVNFIDDIKSRNIPIILASSKIEGYPSVSFDNKSGVSEGITYLIKEAGVHNICMLRSKEHNIDCKERYDAYLEMMDHYRLDVGPNSVIATNLTSECAEDCERILDLNPDAEAIICVNDIIAMTLYNVMKARGLTPGKEIKVMGFDNSQVASIITPSLTTVDADAIHLGHRIFTMVRMMMEGWDVGETTIPTRFILRDSFGSLLDKENTDQSILDKQNLDEYFHRIFYKFDDATNKDSFEILLTFKTVMTIIIDYISSKDYSLERVNFLKNKVDDFFKLGPLDYTDATVLLSYVDRVKTAALNKFPEFERKCQAHETFAAIMEKIVMTIGKDEEQEDLNDEWVPSLRTMIDNVLDYDSYDDSMYTEIITNLAGFGVQNAYVYIYDKPIRHLNGEPFNRPDSVRLKAYMNNGNISSIPSDKQSINIDNLFDNEYIEVPKYNMVLMPLYFREILYGSILYDLTDISFRNGESLAKHYAVVARIIDKFRH